MTVRFGPFRVDVSDERLWRDSEPVRLTRKAWGVLRVLLDARGRLVTKDTLAEAVWPGVHVGDDSLTKAVRELRHALGDDQRAPRFIATVHGRGYRFVAPLDVAPPDAAAAPPAASSGADAPLLVGRERQLETLHEWLVQARHGQRRIGVVSGEVGIGKSSLVDAFMAAALREPDAIHVAAGACVEQYGEAEPLLPVIAALRRAARSDDAAAVLRQVAPPWLAVACGVGRATDAADGIGSRAGLLRILADVVEALAADTPLVLLIEDLQWSDPTTLDVVNLLARRRDGARLLVLCTLRVGDAFAAGHPSARLVRELCRGGQAGEIALAPLAPGDVQRYLTVRLNGHPPPGAVAHLIQHTGGNPFFIRTLTDDLLAHGSLRHEAGRWVLHAAGPPAIPAGSLAALAPRLERLSGDERAMLEAASVIGDAFTATAVADALTEAASTAATVDEVESACARWVRTHDILRGGESHAPYAFQHALYRQALYEGIPPARRARLHARVGEALAARRPADSREGAAELAEHFSRAGDHARAVAYHTQAAMAAGERFADREVAAHLAAALTALRQCPESTERNLQELMLVPQHAAAKMVTRGFGDPSILEDCRRARTLARQLQIPLAEFVTTAALNFLHLMRAQLDDAATLAAELADAAPSLALPECAAAADAAAGAVLFSRGDLAAARALLEPLRGRFPRRGPGFPFDATVWHLALLAMLHADLGEASAARATTAELLAAAGGGPPAELANAHMLVAGIEAQLRSPARVLEHIDTAIGIGLEEESFLLIASASQLRGWALAAVGDLAGARAAYADQGASWLAIGQRLGTPLLAVLRAESALRGDDLVTATAAIRAGLAHARETGECRLDSDLYRLRAECLRRSGLAAAAATAMERSLAIAERQGARLAALRAALDNLRLHSDGPAANAAAERLASIAAAFDAGEPLPELTAALRHSDSSAA